MSVGLRRLTYHPVVSDLARTLHARDVLRWVYLKWVAPQGVLRMNVSGLRFSLQVATAEEARALDGTTMSEGVDWSETSTLEQLLAVTNPGDVVYDVGANFGLYSLTLSKRVGEGGKVFAFEPLTSNYKRLISNLDLNGSKNVVCFQKALGEKANRVEIYVDAERPWCSSLVKRKSTGLRKAVEVVEVLCGDTLRNEETLPVPRIVKIDVEGYEYSVIKGLSRTLSDNRCEYVACEVHPKLLPPGVASEDVFGLLRSLGFNRIDSHKRGPEEHALCSKS